MLFQTMGKILESNGVKKDGSAYLVADTADATVFISLGYEVLSIQRVARVDTVGDLIALATHKGERFYFAPEQVVGLKFGALETGMPRSQAGFR
jgi:hypothetical protein